MKNARKIFLAAVTSVTSFTAVASSNLCFAVDAVGSAPAPAAAPATRPAVSPVERPVNPDIAKMINSLADEDPAIREAATQGLQKLGREVLPQLKENVESENPEIRSRVRTLIRQAERRLPPAAPKRDGAFGSHSTRMSITNGRKTIDIDDNGYKIRIEQTDDGIRMSVTGEENGKEVTESYTARDADQLKRENPEAFALYEKYNNNGFQVHGFAGNGVQGNVQIQIQGGGVQGGVFINPNGGGIQIAPGGFGGRRGRPDPNQPQQPLPEEVQKKIQEQLKQQNVPEDQRRIIEPLLERIERQQQDVQEQVQKQLEQERRKAVDDLKVPEREEKKVEPKAEEKKDAK